MSKKINCKFLKADKQAALRVRLNRIAGQIKGIHKMVDVGKSCIEILNQLTSVERALKGSKQLVFRNYLETCATKAIRKSRSEGVYDELMEVIYKYA